MRITRNLVAYRLLAMHPVLHMTMFLACGIAYFSNTTEFINLRLSSRESIIAKDICKSKKDNEHLIQDIKSTLIIQMVVHVLASLLYWQY